MKLLFDQNISYKIIHRISDLLPESKHVSMIGLYDFKDIEIWNFAQKNGFTIVTLDSDFVNFSTLYGCPPKAIIIKNFNASTNTVSDIIRNSLRTITEFIASEDCILLLR